VKKGVGGAQLFLKYEATGINPQITQLLHSYYRGGGGVLLLLAGSALRARGPFYLQFSYLFCPLFP
jgi:hypothetical protein